MALSKCLIILSGGGTGGHTTPLLAIRNRFRSDERFDFLWIGEADSLEEKVAASNAIRFRSIQAGKLRRYWSFKTILEPFKIISGIWTAASILRKEHPSLIISKGGYVSLPVAIASKMLRIPLFLHESDSVPGLANRVVGRFAKVIYLGFPAAAKWFNAKKAKVVGQILNPILFSGKKGKDVDSRNRKTNLLVIGGSQGSTRIFRAILDNAERYSDFRIAVVLGSLNAHLQPEFAQHPNIDIYGFIDQSKLRELYEEADIAITRAGATSLAELDAFGIRMIMIPLKESANNHQYHNALEYEKQGHLLIEEADLDSLAEKLDKLHSYKKDRTGSGGSGGLDQLHLDVVEACGEKVRSAR